MKENFASKKKVFSWALFDFANQPFSTIIITFVFSTYFISNIGNASLWSLTIGISSLMIAFFSPFIGAVADVSNTRNLMFKLFTYLCIVSCFFLYLPLATSSIIYSLTFVIIANFAFEISCMFYNSYLSEISTKRNIGRISGYAWGLGFFGGVLSLLIVKSFFNLESTNINISKSIREINLFISVWFLIFSIPFFYIIRNRTGNSSRSYTLLVIRDQFVNSYNEIRKTFNEVRKYKKIAKFLLSRLFYNDALITIFAFGGSFAEQVLGFDIEDVILFAIALNISAGIGSFIFGFIEDKVGAIRVIDFSLKGLIFATFLAFVSPFFFYDIQLFWIAGIMLGLLVGPVQSASRSLMAQMIPENKKNEFFGFFSFTGKATAMIGPFIYGLVFDNVDKILSILVVLTLFSVGYLLFDNFRDN